jgi:hypothetical protein
MVQCDKARRPRRIPHLLRINAKQSLFVGK